jgi:N-acyl-L-homoserine lactone synthetase
MQTTAITEYSNASRCRTLPVQRLMSRLVAGRCGIASSTAELEKIYALRYKIYIEELKKPLPWADHSRKYLRDQYDRDATHFLVSRFGGKAVGCARLHVGTAIPRYFIDSMQIGHIVARDGDNCGYVSKLMVDRSLRGKGAALLMMMQMIEYGATRGEYAVFHCNPKLCRLYERYGFRRFGRPFEMEHVGKQVSMVNIFADADHFAKVGSPLTEFVRKYRASEERLQVLRATFFAH